MAMEVNGCAILSTIARSPEAFGSSQSQNNQLAVNIVLTKFKDKTVKLETIRAISSAIGMQDFALIIDCMPSKDAAALTKRIDPKHPNLKTSGDAWLRAQLVDLAAGKVEPALPQPRSPKVGSVASTKSRTPKTGTVMKSKALKPRSRKP